MSGLAQHLQQASSRAADLQHIRALRQRYADHMLAMTAEGLHSKGAIAAELAWRDWQRDCERDARRRLQLDYEALQARVRELEALLREARTAIATDRNGWPIEFERGEHPTIDKIDAALKPAEQCPRCHGSKLVTIRGMCGGVEMDCDGQPCPECTEASHD